MEHNKNCSSELKMGYTIAEENGLYNQLENQGIINFFDFEKYGESFGYDYELLDNGYLISDYDIDLQLYSEEEINEAIKEMEDFEIEI